jgi:hypothetical protein
VRFLDSLICFLFVTPFDRYKRTYELNPEIVELPDEFEEIVTLASKFVVFMQYVSCLIMHSFCFKVFLRRSCFRNPSFV